MIGGRLIDLTLYSLAPTVGPMADNTDVAEATNMLDINSGTTSKLAARQFNSTDN
ncbi:hypothetical protein TIFTF001_044655 [Ficus carica]|uniref:Uncharacterized protein n=1 Tax=Ficus carica TaxID=3494 RepID=A0AA88CVN2_FICCA|nr:hypothetical protein TIFTF001_044655 [Ficus carica]